MLKMQTQGLRLAGQGFLTGESSDPGLSFRDPQECLSFLGTVSILSLVLLSIFKSGPCASPAWSRSALCRKLSFTLLFCPTYRHQSLPSLPCSWVLEQGGYKSGSSAWAGGFWAVTSLMHGVGSLDTPSPFTFGPPGDFAHHSISALESVLLLCLGCGL